MQPVNDDMDNLFRRAAEDYPLKSDGADFNKVKQLLNAENSLPSKKSDRKSYFWLLLLLLIPLAFLLGRYYKVNTNKANNNNTHTYANEETATTNTNRTTDTTTNKRIVENKPNTPVIHTDEETKTQQSEKVSTAKQSKNDQPLNPGNRIATKNQVVINKKSLIREQNNKSIAALDKQPSSEDNSNETVVQSAKNKGKIAPGSLPGKEELSKTKVNTESAYIVKSNPIIDNADSVHKTVPVKKVVDTSNVLAKKSIDTVHQVATKKAPEKNKIAKKPFVYIGVVGGPDASTVKSNRSSGTGYNTGFIAGYHTGKHLAFETGISWNYKKYYSDGKHVTVDKLGLAQHSTIIYLEGNCGMIELPVNIKYHFNTKGNHNWYTGAGISSYIMKNEEYDYLSSRYGITYYGDKKYKNSTTNWLSVLQFNIGYQLNINKVITLRVEPYAKLPLQGLGIGKLPISSAGVNVGFTLPIH